MKKIKILLFSFLFANVGLHANVLQLGNDEKEFSNVYTGKIRIVKSDIYYNKLILQNAEIRYPHYSRPISFKVKKLIINGEGKNKLYGWRLVKIGMFDGNTSKIFVDSRGAIYIDNIKDNNLKNILIGKYATLIYLGFNQKNKKRVNLKILLDKKIKKR